MPLQGESPGNDQLRASFPAALKDRIRNPETETETKTEYGICERRFQAIDLKKNISNDNKINKQIKKKTQMNKLAE